MKSYSTLLPIVVAIPTRNEEANLKRCLSGLSRFAEVLIIDSGSTDRTVEIAREYGAHVLQFNWSGAYPKKRNWFLLKHSHSQQWVLFLDADEFVDDSFCDAVSKALLDDRFNGYWLNYTNYFLSKRLNYGLEQRKLALFRVGKGLYERIDEESWTDLDMEIHEHPIIEGNVGEIRAPIDHKDDKGLSKFIGRHLDYAQWESERYRRLQVDKDAWVHFTPRQRFKYRNITRWWYPTFYFLFTYVARFGFLDGAAGFHYAFYKAWYFHTIRLLIREQRS